MPALWLCLSLTIDWTPPPPVIETQFPLVIHVGTRDGKPVADAARIDRLVALANRHFAPAGIELVPDVRPLPEGWAHLKTIRERHQLKQFLVDRHVNVFLLAQIDDPVASAATRRAAATAGIKPTGKLGGAHIVSDRHRPGTYVILSLGGSPLSMTHELGHFFGVAHHPRPDNIMSYSRERHRFDARQLEKFRARARRYLKSKDVRPAP